MSCGRCVYQKPSVLVLDLLEEQKDRVHHAVRQVSILKIKCQYKFAFRQYRKTYRRDRYILVRVFATCKINRPIVSKK